MSLFIAGYDEKNIFAKILRGEMECKKVYEDDYIMAFHDVNPQAPVHVLVVPKSKHASLVEFAAESIKSSHAAFIRGIGMVAHELGLDEGGYRVIINTGEAAGQEVPHLHAHILGGKALGKMLPQAA